MKPYHHVSVDAEMKQDTKMWLNFLVKDPTSVRKSFVDLSKVLLAVEISFFSDASASENKGLGCLFEHRWCFALWERSFIKQYKPSIGYLELYAVTVAIHLWAKHLSDRRVVIFCDNLSIAHLINQIAQIASFCCD